MGVVDQILREERERQRADEERRQREDAAFHAVLSLPVESRRAVLARLIDAEEAVATAGPLRVEVMKMRGSFTERAEAFVRSRPDGVKTREVADAIGQDVSGVDGTLRGLLKKGRIERRGRLWLPVTATNGAAKYKAKLPPVIAKKPTIRDLITAVLVEQKVPLGAQALYEAIRKGPKPTINRASVDGEIVRMRKDKVLVQAGVGPNNGGLYALATEAANAAN